MPSTEFQCGPHNWRTAASQPELWRGLDCYVSTTNWKEKKVTVLLHLKSAPQTSVVLTEAKPQQQHKSTQSYNFHYKLQRECKSVRGKREYKAWTWDEERRERRRMGSVPLLVSMWQFKPGACLLCIWNQFEMGDVRDCLKDTWSPLRR